MRDYYWSLIVITTSGVPDFALPLECLCLRGNEILPLESHC
jgi:hypothetical protein